MPMRIRNLFGSHDFLCLVIPCIFLCPLWPKTSIAINSPEICHFSKYSFVIDLVPRTFFISSFFLICSFLHYTYFVFHLERWMVNGSKKRNLRLIVTGSEMLPGLLMWGYLSAP